MTVQKDIYRAAHVLMKKHGSAAESMALSRVDHFMEAQDVVGASTWLMIAQAIQELEKITADATIH